MANGPLRILANLPKNPYSFVDGYDTESKAVEVRDALRADGYDAKVTSARTGPKNRFYRTYNVWMREKIK